MTEGHKNEVGDRVSIALISGKGKENTFTQGSLFDNEILLRCVIAKRFEMTQGHEGWG